MQNGKKQNVAVVGAGIVGVCSALWLQREGYDVTLIDPNPPGSGASYGNAGAFSPASVVPMAMPGVLRHVPGYLLNPHGPLAIHWGYLPKLAPWLLRFIRSGRCERVDKQAAALAGLLGPVFDCLMPLAKQAEATHLIRRDGFLYVYRTEAALRGDAYGWELRRRHGIAFDILEGPEIKEFDPALSPDYHAALFVPGNGHTVDPQGLVQHLARAVEKAGGRHFKASAEDFKRDGSAVRAVLTDRGEVACDFAVIAAGARSARLAARLGEKIPLDTERGYHLMLKSPEAMPRVPVLEAMHKFVATPMQAGLRIAGTVEFAGLDRPPNMDRARRLLRPARALFPALREDYPESEMSKWMGFRPSLPDSLPVIGRSKASPGIVYAFGHGHVGMCGGPMTGKLVAEMIAGRPTSIDIAPFSQSRF